MTFSIHSDFFDTTGINVYESIYRPSEIFDVLSLLVYKYIVPLGLFLSAPEVCCREVIFGGVKWTDWFENDLTPKSPLLKPGEGAYELSC